MISLKRIHIKNFRAYEDVEINFETVSGVTLMAGGNGAGKSTFLNAICWCLYADTPFFAIGDSHEIINKHVDPHSSIEVEIEAVIDGVTYTFFRKANAEGRGGQLTVSYEDNGNWTVLDSSANSDAVKKLLPKDIRHLFIFNGEQISDIFKPGTNNNLRRSIEKVAELDVIDKSIAHLRLVEDAYLKEIEKENKNKKQIEAFRHRQLILLGDLDREEKARKIIESKIAVEEANLDELNKVVEATASAREKLQTLSILNDNLRDIEEELRELSDDKTEKILDNYHKVLLFPEFKKYAAALELAKERNEIPPPIVPAVTERILETKMCICGRQIHDAEEHFIQNEHRLNSEKEEMRYLTNGIFLAQQDKGDLRDVRHILEDIYATINTRTQRKDEIQAKIAEMHDSLDEENVVAHDNPVARRNDIAKLKDQLTSARGRHSNQIEIYNRELRQIEDEIDRIVKKDATTDKLDRKRKLTKRLVNHLTAMKQGMEEQIRKKLRDSLEETFFNILPNTKFDSIQIDNEYNVSLYSGELEYKTTEISTGQAKALGLSLAYSLSKNLDYASFPMLIDNLYGQLSEAHYEEVSKTIEALSETKQVIIMDLNAEKTKSLFRDDSLSQFFNIVRDSSENSTKIVEAV